MWVIPPDLNGLIPSLFAIFQAMYTHFFRVGGVGSGGGEAGRGWGAGSRRPVRQAGLSEEPKLYT